MLAANLRLPWTARSVSDRMILGDKQNYSTNTILIRRDVDISLPSRPSSSSYAHFSSSGRLQRRQRLARALMVGGTGCGHLTMKAKPE